MLPNAVNMLMTERHAAAKSVRLVITGASGVLGRQIVPHLRAMQVEMLLVGRNPVVLSDLYPYCRSVGYEDIETAAYDYDALLHLATLNSDADETVENFNRVNVDLALQTCAAAQQAGIRKFIFTSSTHALDPAVATAYAQTKRAAVAKLSEKDGVDVRALYLPAVVGNELSGRLRALNAMPAVLRRCALAVLTSLKPTVDVERIANTVITIASSDELTPKSMVVSNGQTGNLAYNVFKRLFDLSFALGVLVGLGWLMIAIGVAIRIESRGPALFKQIRVGRHQRTFTCLKFRTMHVAAPNVGTHEVSAAFVTRLGGFLRRTKLDELPQVFNIIMNQMSLVGPRPSLPSQLDVVAARLARGGFVAKPGITGLAQVCGIDMSNPCELAAADEMYLKLQSILLDFKIIVQTAFGKGGGDNVRRP